MNTGHLCGRGAHDKTPLLHGKGTQAMVVGVGVKERHTYMSE